MGNSVQVLEIVVPVIAMIIMGMFFREKLVLSDDGIGTLKHLLVNFCIPALVFKAFYSTQFTWKSLLLVLIMFVVTAASYYIGRGLMRQGKFEEELFPYLCTTIEGGQMGFALFILLFGQDNLYHLALLDLGNALILFPVIVTRMKLRAQGVQVSRREIAHSLVTPINVAIFSGIIVSVTGLGRVILASDFGAVLNSVLSLAGAPASTLILLVVGYGLSFRRIRWLETLRTIGIRALIMAVFGTAVFLIVRGMFPDDPLYRYAVIMAFTLPPSYMYSMFTKGKDEEAYVGAVLALYTVITIIGFIILAAISAG